MYVLHIEVLNKDRHHRLHSARCFRCWVHTRFIELHSYNICIGLRLYVLCSIVLGLVSILVGLYLK